MIEFPMVPCPKCGSRQWVRTVLVRERWVCYECPTPSGRRLGPHDVLRWCFISRSANEAVLERLPTPLLGNLVIRDDDVPVAGSGRMIPVSARDPLLPAIPTAPCDCGCGQFFCFSTGAFVCYRCHKPPHDEMIEEWWCLVG